MNKNRIGGLRWRASEPIKRHVNQDLAARTAGSPHGPWRIANSPALALALPNAYFAQLGLPSMVERF
jgi:RNA-directed DNA polymerase